MSNSVGLSVFGAISFASVVGSMKANIAAAPITSVRIPVGCVNLILDNAVYGTISYLYPLFLLRKVQRRTCWDARVRRTGG
jgi:hypothetical protein